MDKSKLLVFCWALFSILSFSSVQAAGELDDALSDAKGYTIPADPVSNNIDGVGHTDFDPKTGNPRSMIDKKGDYYTAVNQEGTVFERDGKQYIRTPDGEIAPQSNRVTTVLLDSNGVEISHMGPNDGGHYVFIDENGNPVIQDANKTRRLKEVTAGEPITVKEGSVDHVVEELNGREVKIEGENPVAQSPDQNPVQEVEAAPQPDKQVTTPTEEPTGFVDLEPDTESASDFIDLDPDEDSFWEIDIPDEEVSNQGRDSAFTDDDSMWEIATDDAGSDTRGANDGSLWDTETASSKDSGSEFDFDPNVNQVEKDLAIWKDNERRRIAYEQEQARQRQIARQREARRASIRAEQDRQEQAQAQAQAAQDEGGGWLSAIGHGLGVAGIIVGISEGDAGLVSDAATLGAALNEMDGNSDAAGLYGAIATNAGSYGGGGYGGTSQNCTAQQAQAINAAASRTSGDALCTGGLQAYINILRNYQGRCGITQSDVDAAVANCARCLDGCGGVGQGQTSVSSGPKEGEVCAVLVVTGYAPCGSDSAKRNGIGPERWASPKTWGWE